jgi:glycosyltransferase involved in cell wall biosynthesis
MGQRNLELVRAHTTRYVAASHAAKTFLCSDVGIAVEIIDVVHEFIPVSGVQLSPTANPSLRAKLGIPANALVVAGSGFETHRKGKDLFVLLAAEVQRTNPARSCHFVWIGGWENDSNRRQIETMVHDSQLSGRVTFVGQVSNPLDYFAAADVFAMVSREDPFPLVCLEAAALSKPVLCFADAGGMPEFVEDDCGFVVPFLDLEEMARKILLLAGNRMLLEALGANAARKVRNRHDVSVGGPRIVNVIRELLNH